MKTKIYLLALVLGISLLGGCGNTTENSKKEETKNETTDVVSSASVATDEDTLKKALKDSWIVILKNDISTTNELVLEGDFTKPDPADKTKMIPAGRNLSLYQTDEKQNKVASYTLSTPKLIIKSKDTKIKGGTVVGDVYVEAEGFSLVDAKVEGNIYFSKQEYKDTYKLEDNSTVTGVQEVK